MLGQQASKCPRCLPLPTPVNLYQKIIKNISQSTVQVNFAHKVHLERRRRDQPESHGTQVTHMNHKMSDGLGAMKLVIKHAYSK
jgi:hypothetical protein